MTLSGKIVQIHIHKNLFLEIKVILLKKRIKCVLQVPFRNKNLET